MKKYILVILIAIAGVAPVIFFRSELPRLKIPGQKKSVCNVELKACEDNIIYYLKIRKDKLAATEIEKTLAMDKNNLCALWGKAEILRRNYKMQESEAILKQVLSKCTDHNPSLITLAYIRYYNNQFNPALKILKQVLNNPDLGTEDKALVYMLIGTVNAKKSSQGGLFGKVVYGTRIKGYFEKAKTLAPDLAEVHLGLGTFYLLAPRIAGGNLDKAIEELWLASKITPDFATPKARLAQAYKKKGNSEKYNLYFKQAKELDPENEVLKEISYKD